jgi:hypothetical protein
MIQRTPKTTSIAKRIINNVGNIADLHKMKAERPDKYTGKRLRIGSMGRILSPLPL